MILKLVSRLPLGVLYSLASFISFLMRYVAKYRLDVVRDNINQCFPEKSASEKNQIINQFYKNLGDFMVETLKGMTISEEDLRRRVKIIDSEIIEKYFQNNQSVLIMTGHQFNWEWLLLACCIQLSAPMSPVYKLLNNQYFENLMFAMRSRFGGQPIEMQSTLMEIMKRKGAVNGFGLLADQTPMPEAEKYWAQFLGRETAFYVGPQKLALMTKYPVVFASVQKVQRGHYEVSFKSVAEPPYDKNGHEVLDNYIRLCQELLKSQPANWLWSHRRWKYSKPLYDD